MRWNDTDINTVCYNKHGQLDLAMAQIIRPYNWSSEYIQAHQPPNISGDACKTLVQA